MLSRIAESLFWIGRYVERAEDTARILDVHIHHLLEAPLSSESDSCRVLVRAMGAGVAEGAEPTDVDPALVTDLLAFNESNPSSIVSSLKAARSNARGVSEAISSEMWEALNATYHSLPAQVTLGRLGAHGFFRFVRDRAAVFAGLTDSTMSRDDAWRFLVAGRSLERVDMLARLLSTAGASGTATATSVDWVLLLRSFSAHEAFLRTYRREPDLMLAAEFLILDRLFPRSIYAALATGEACLAGLDPRVGAARGARAARAGNPDEARRILGVTRTNLEFRRIEDLLADLPGQLASIQSSCTAAATALAARYFHDTSPIEWTLERVGGAPAMTWTAR